VHLTSTSTSTSTSTPQLSNAIHLDNARAELYHNRLDKLPGASWTRLVWYGQVTLITYISL
jgi:SPX domain protein involved in polyphosphate accumulation